MKMPRIARVSVLAAAVLFVPSVFAETGVGTLQIDNVANVYGRAGVPNVRIAGAVVTRGADVITAGRKVAPADGAKTLLSAGQFAQDAAGRS
jgi:hypothetical protein